MMDAIKSLVSKNKRRHQEVIGENGVDFRFDLDLTCILTFLHDSGYPQDGRADKNPYPHDHRADKLSAWQQ